MPKICLANGKVFNGTETQSILDAARQQGVILEYSCRTGRCGSCKAQLTAGRTQRLQPEESLSEEEESAGYILTCCRVAITDIQLDILDLSELADIKTKTLPCRIDALVPLASDVIEVVLRTPPTGKLEFFPGQYVDVIGKQGLRRSYSVANAPRADGKVTLHIRRVEKGRLSRYWFDEAKENDLLRLEGPLGTFFLRQSNQTDLVLLATGTGIAPLKAILEHLAANPKASSYKKIHLYWGARTEQDIYWAPSFANLPLEFSPVLSRVTNGRSCSGYIQDAVIEDRIDLRASVVYACGSEAMIKSAYEKLVGAGLERSNFYSDAFVSAN